MYCSKCGKEIEDSSTFCMHCGYQIKADAPADTQVQTGSSKNLVLTLGKILTMVGLIGVWTIVDVSLVIWHKIYLFNGYEYTKILCTICLFLMIGGSVCLIISLVKMIKNKEIKFQKGNFIFSLILLTLAFSNTVMLLINYFSFMKK